MATVRAKPCVSDILCINIRVLTTVIWKIGYRIIVIISSTAAAAVYCLLFLPLHTLK